MSMFWEKDEHDIWTTTKGHSFGRPFFNEFHIITSYFTYCI